MRYDDPARPMSEMADNSPLQVNGSPLPVITLIRPMESEGEGVARCTCNDSLARVLSNPSSFKCINNPSEDCEACEISRPTVWGWLACIHGHVEGPRFSYHTAWLRSLEEFNMAYLADPELALAKYFRYLGPEARRAPAVAPDLWEAEGVE